MPTNVLLPQADMGTQDAMVVRWLKHEGDHVDRDEELVELETSKTIEALVAPVSGTVARILVPEGATVMVRSVLCIITEPGETLETQVQAPAPVPAVAKASAVPLPSAVSAQVEPRARRLAQQKGIDLSRLTGSGPGGRITESDVDQAANDANVPDEQVVPLTGMRGAIAQRMMASLQSTAQFTLTTEVDVTLLVEARERIKPPLDVSINDLLVKAVALALKAHPKMNAVVDGQQIRILSQINIGIAVALTAGLIVPVLRQVNHMSLAQVAAESRELVRRARAGQLNSSDLSGGTFSVSNLGMYDVDTFTPVINAPEVAILGFGRIVERAARLNGDLVWKQTMTLSLTIDHRAVDGAPAAAFLQTLARYLQRSDVLFSSDIGEVPA